MLTTSNVSHPHTVLSASTVTTTPQPSVEITAALYTAAHKALCSLAFALQEVEAKRQSEREIGHATSEQCQAQEEAVERRQHHGDNGKSACHLSNGRTAQVSRQRANSSLRAAIIIIPVPK